MSLAVQAPLAGTVIALEQVPDPVFAGRFVGPGTAIDPDLTVGEVTAVAPVAGTVAKVHPHAFVIAADDGRGILVHLGLDTVGLKGEGFTVHVGDGDRVAVGDAVVTWNPADVADRGLSPVVPVVALEAAEEDVVVSTTGTVEQGDELLNWA